MSDKLTENQNIYILYFGGILLCHKLQTKV